MDLDTFFGLEKVVSDILLLRGYDGDESFAIAFIHPIMAALFFLVFFILSPFKVLRPVFSWLGYIWIGQTIMAVIFIGLAFFITKGDISMARTFYLYFATLVITIIMHIDTSRMTSSLLMKMSTDQHGRIDLSFRTKGKIPHDS